jgi:hypothetical protein
VLVPVFVLGGGAIAYAMPHIWKDGDTLNASDLNGNFSALDGRVAALESPANGTWQSYPVDLVDALNPATKITTGVAHNTAYYRRRGDSIEVRIYTDFNGQPTPSGVIFGWTLPTGLSVDRSKLPGNQTGFPFRDFLGSGVWSYNGSANMLGVVGPVPSYDVVQFSVDTASVRTDTPNIASGVFTLSFSVPVTP